MTGKRHTDEQIIAVVETFRWDSLTLAHFGLIALLPLRDFSPFDYCTGLEKL